MVNVCGGCRLYFRRIPGRLCPVSGNLSGVGRPDKGQAHFYLVEFSFSSRFTAGWMSEFFSADLLEAIGQLDSREDDFSFNSK
jgi:hypothetical protein